MSKPRPEKKRTEKTPTQPAEQRVLPMQLQVGDRLTDETGEYEVIGRPYTTNTNHAVHDRPFDPQPFDINNDPLPCGTGPLAPSQTATVSVTAFLTQEILSSSVQIVLPNGQPSLVDTRTGCIVSAQVIDNFTSWTTVLLLP